MRAISIETDSIPQHEPLHLLPSSSSSSVPLSTTHFISFILNPPLTDSSLLCGSVSLNVYLYLFLSLSSPSLVFFSFFVPLVCSHLTSTLIMLVKERLTTLTALKAAYNQYNNMNISHKWLSDSAKDAQPLLHLVISLLSSELGAI